MTSRPVPPRSAHPSRYRGVDKTLLEYCRLPKSEPDILAKLRCQYRDRILRERLQELIHEGKVRIIRNQCGTLYQWSADEHE